MPRKSAKPANTATPAKRPRPRNAPTGTGAKKSGYYAYRNACALGADPKHRCSGETVKIEDTPYYLCSGVHYPRYELIVTAEMLRRQTPGPDDAPSHPKAATLAARAPLSDQIALPFLLPSRMAA